VDLFAVENDECFPGGDGGHPGVQAVTDLPVMATMFFQFEELHDRDRTMWARARGGRQEPPGRRRRVVA